MLFDNNVVGVLCLWRFDVHPFDDRAAALLRTFAAQAAIAITHVELVRTLEARTAELAQKVEQLQALGTVIETVNSSLDLDEVLSTIVRHAVQLSETDGGSIMVASAQVPVADQLKQSRSWFADLRSDRRSLWGRAPQGRSPGRTPGTSTGATDVPERQSDGTRSSGHQGPEGNLMDALVTCAVVVIVGIIAQHGFLFQYPHEFASEVNEFLAS